MKNRRYNTPIAPALQGYNGTSPAGLYTCGPGILVEIIIQPPMIGWIIILYFIKIRYQPLFDEIQQQMKISYTTHNPSINYDAWVMCVILFSEIKDRC